MLQSYTSPYPDSLNRGHISYVIVTAVTDFPSPQLTQHSPTTFTLRIRPSRTRSTFSTPDIPPPRPDNNPPTHHQPQNPPNPCSSNNSNNNPSPHLKRLPNLDPRQLPEFAPPIPAPEPPLLTAHASTCGRGIWFRTEPGRGSGVGKGKQGLRGRGGGWRG